MNTTEGMIERYLVKRVESTGGVAIKFTSSSNRGVPDRMCLFPSGKVVFIEVKKPDGRLSRLQSEWLWRLKKLNQTAIVINSRGKVDHLIAYAKKEGWYE